MDLVLSPIPANAVYMTMNSLGAEDRELTKIGSGANVSMRSGRASQNVSVVFQEDGECFVNYMEMSAALARRLKLRPSRRYLLEYDASSSRLTVQPSPVSSAFAALKAVERQSPGSIYIGYALRSILGIADQRLLKIHVRSGTKLLRLAVHTSGNLLDRGLRLSSSVVRALRLPVSTPLLLTYDQRTQTLYATLPRTAANTKTGDA